MARKTRINNVFEKLEKIEKLHNEIDINKPKSKKTLIYSRLSSVEDKKDTVSIENQVDICKQYINDFNKSTENQEKIEILDIFMDNGYTGANMNRPDFIKMYDLIKKGEIDTLIVKDLSRIGRNYIDVGQFINDLVYEYNVEIIAVTDNFFSRNIENRNELLMFAFKNIMNDFFREDIRRKVIKAKKRQLEQGIHIGEVVYGYRRCKITKKFIVNEEEAKVVKKIFDMRIKEYNCYEIAKSLNDLGIKLNNNNIWQYSTVYNILDNIEYTGDLILGKTTDLVETYTIKNAHEPIISKEIFERVNFKSTLKEYGYTVSDGKYIIRPNEASIVKKIFEYAEKGYNLIEISELLNNDNILYKNNKWRADNVSIVLRNNIYLKEHYNENKKKQKPLISVDLYNKVRLLNQKRPYGFYYKTKNELVPIKNELEIVKKIYEERAKGLSLKKICELLDVYINNHTKKITVSVVSKIINNGIYEKYQKENNFIIIPESTLQKVNRLKYNKYIPYGYKKIKDELIEDKKESEIVKLIFKLRIGGLEYTKIAKYLENNKIELPAYYENWNLHNIKRIIQNKAYIGVFKNSRYLKNFILPKGFIDIELFNKANEVGAYNG